MSKHAGPSEDERNGAAVATIAVVGLLGVVVSLLAIFRPSGSESPAATEILPPSRSATSASSSAVPPPQRVLKGAAVLPARTLAPQKVGKVGKHLRHQTEQAAEQEPTTFRVSTFNVLGASHTSPGGNKRGWAPAATRMGWAVSILRASDVDVVGFQEFESSQYRSFLARTAGGWGVYPGLSADPEAVRDSIAWRTDTWQLVDARTIPVPYFHGNRVPVPYVRLHNIESGQDVYFLNVHNPATTGRWGDNERWRDAATALEVNLVNQLQAAGFPVVLTGDFNERDEAFCKVTGSASMRAANGGSTGGACAPPPNMNVDWIFGSSTITFSGFSSQKSGLVVRTTDHPFVVADATIPPLEEPQPDQ